MFQIFKVPQNLCMSFRTFGAYRMYSTYYTSSHEYINVDNNVGTCGITKYAADKVDEVIYATLPDLSDIGEGETVEKGETVAEIETIKSCEEIKSPVSGTITDINVSLEDNYHLISTDPEGSGWVWKMDLNNIAELNDLMNEEEYKKYLPND